MPREIQSEIPGTEAPRIKAIETAAATYTERRDARMKMLTKELEAKTKLIEACQQNLDKMAVNGDGARVYRFDEEMVVFSDKLQVRVKAASEEDPDED